MTEVTIDDLLRTIGRLTVENELLRRQLAELQARLVQPVSAKIQPMAQEDAANNKELTAVKK